MYLLSILYYWQLSTAGYSGTGFNKITISLIVINPSNLMNKYQPLKNCISSNNHELVIYWTDNFSQFPRRDASVSSKCDRALPAARRNNVVVLRGKLDLEHHNWLHWNLFRIAKYCPSTTRIFCCCTISPSTPYVANFSRDYIKLPLVYTFDGKVVIQGD